MTQQSKISKNNTSVVMENGTQTVILHNSPVVKHVPGSRHVQFDTHGYFTSTTKTRMNQAMEQWGLPLSVTSKDGQWYVHNSKSGVKMSFCGTICIVGY